MNSILLKFVMGSFFMMSILSPWGLHGEELKKTTVNDLVDMSIEDLLNVKIGIATKTSINLDDSPGIVTIIDRKMIESINPQTLVDIVRMIPGMDYSRTSLGWADPVDIFYARGIPSDFSQSILFLLNGKNKFNDFTYASPYNAHRINAELIERIEVIRGPGSTLYGGNALSAVINIITRDVSNVPGQTFELSASDTRSYSAYGLNKFYLFKSDWMMGVQGKFFVDKGSHYDSLSMDKLYDGRPILGAQTVTDGVNPSFDLSMSIASPQEKARFQLWHTDHNPHPFLAGFYPQPNNNNYKYQVKQTFLNLAVNPTKNLSLTMFYSLMSWDARLTAYYDPAIRTATHVYGPDDIYGPTESNRQMGIDVNYNWSLKKHEILIGGSFSRESQYDPSTTYWDPVLKKEVTYKEDTPDMVSYFTHNRNQFSLYIQDHWVITPKLEFTAGLRFDNYNDLTDGSIVNPRLALVWKTSENGRIKLLYGQAFRPPAGIEINGNLGGNIIGNPNVKSERINTSEFAYITYFKFARAQVSLFYSQVLDAIQLVDSEYKNVGEREVYGAEVELQSKSWWINYSYCHSTTDDKIRTPFLSRHMANGGITISVTKNLDLKAQAYYRSPRISMTGIKSKAQFENDLGLSYSYRDITYSLGARNLLNLKYELPLNDGGIYRYPYRGRELYFKVKISL